MARRRGIEPMHDDHVNVTPLIDVIMCLIVFFMVCGNLADKESKEGVNIPKATTDMARPLADQRGRLVINLVPRIGKGEGNADAINPNSEPQVFVRQDEITYNELGEQLRREKTKDPDVKVILRADRNIPYQWISPILVNCAQAGIGSVNFSVTTQ